MRPLRYVTVTPSPGVYPEPAATTTAFLLPEDGVNANCGIGGAGDTGMAMGVTVTAAVPESTAAGSEAVMVVAPVAMPVTSPCEPGAFEIDAVPGNDDDHVTESVRSWVLRSE